MVGHDAFDRIQGKTIVKIPLRVFVCLVGAASGIPTGLFYLECKVRSGPPVLKQSQGTAEGYFGWASSGLSLNRSTQRERPFGGIALGWGGSTPGKETGRGFKRVFCKRLTYIWGWEAGEKRSRHSAWCGFKNRD